MRVTTGLDEGRHQWRVIHPGWQLPDQEKRGRRSTKIRAYCKGIENHDLCHMNDLLNLLRSRLKGPLPGLEAHREVMSYVRSTAQEIKKSRSDYREGAVLVLLYPHEGELHTGLIVRPLYEGVHSGQVAFPGGRKEPDDPDLRYTALREAQEEVGLQPDTVEIIGGLSEIYIPPSNFLVSPFIGFTAYRPDFVADPHEVAQIIETPLQVFLRNDAIADGTVSMNNGARLRVQCFSVSGHMVWGATAMMLAELRALLLPDAH